MADARPPICALIEGECERLDPTGCIGLLECGRRGALLEPCCCLVLCAPPVVWKQS